ncbi:MAG TPA: trigger factor [Gemmatimonadaceae bacterium]|nr:trigger factor [Gemmatimonadaceae bacterium]
MNIAITPKKAEGLERLLEVSVPVDEVRVAEDKAARRYASKVRVPGFRPGKAPAAIVRKRFGDAIRQEAMEALVQAAFQEVVEREKLQLATQPHVHDVRFGDGQPLTFELHLEVRPEIELPRTSGFKVTRIERPVTDDLIRERLDALREQQAAWAPVSEHAMPGDLVTVTLATTDDDGAMSEGKEYRLVLGGGQAIAGIEELIMETAPGSTSERPVKWPEDFPDEAERGKTKTVRVTVNDVKRKALPELDDDFAREVGDFDSMDALRTAVREDLTSNVAREADAEVRQKLIDEVIGANPFEVPPSWVQQLVQAYIDSYKVPEAEQERFRGEFRPMAERQVRRDLVIDTLAEREKLAATEADIDERVASIAEQRGSEPGQVYASLQKAGRIKELERSLTEEKVFGWLIERNVIE